MADDLFALLRLAQEREMTAEQAEAQRRSFAYGNVQMENSLVTRELVDAVADRTPPAGE